MSSRPVDWLHPFKAPRPFEPASLPYLLLTSPVKLLLQRAYDFFTYLRTPPSSTEPPIRIVCISDTHTCTRDDIPDGDILIHAGDLTNDGTVADIQKQVDWLSSLPHKHIVAIAGNHDTYLDPRTRPSLSEEGRARSIHWGRIHYLQHSSVTLKLATESSPSASQEHLIPKQRQIRIYGAPQIPQCGPMSSFAFQYPRGLDAWSETVPEDTTILVTHTPPKYHMDLSLPSAYGCEHLLAEVERVKPALHVFGHVHWGAGQTIVWWDKYHTAYINGMQTKSRWTRGLLNPRLWSKVGKVIFGGVRNLVWEKIWGGHGQSTLLVNAAQMKGNTGKIGNIVQVVDI